jgi:hypothetical protein
MTNEAISMVNAVAAASLPYEYALGLLRYANACLSMYAVLARDRVILVF